MLGDGPVFGLAGNKKDLFQNEQVNEDEGEKKAKEIGALFKLTSAKNGQMGINEFMGSLLEKYIKKIGEVNDIDPSVDHSTSFSINKKNGKKKIKCC